VGGEFRYRTGELTLPEPIREATIAVLGLDTRPQARAHFRLKQAPSRRPVRRRSPTRRSRSAPRTGSPGYDGTGQTIALIELGGGYDESTLTQYFQSVGVTAPR
jgi:kumamolisin